MQVIAHRGASGYVPEHTLIAKAMAHAMGADYLEQDLVATRDGQAVVLHDIHVDTVTDVAKKFPGRRREDGRYHAIDFTVEELKTLRVFERFDHRNGTAIFPARFPTGVGDFRISTFEEELQFIENLNRSTGRAAGIYPEIKRPAWHREQGCDLSRVTLDALEKHGYARPEARCFLQCFDEFEVKRLRQELDYKGKLVQLIGRGHDPESGTDFNRLKTPEGLADLKGLIDGIGPSLDSVVAWERIRCSHQDGSCHRCASLRHEGSSLDRACRPASRPMSLTPRPCHRLDRRRSRWRVRRPSRSGDSAAHLRRSWHRSADILMAVEETDRNEIRTQIEAAFEEHAQRVRATLIRILGDFDLAEDAVQEAFATAAARWPEQGVPEDPAAWLISAGRFQAIDDLRREARLREMSPVVIERLKVVESSNREVAQRDIEDDRLRLIFTCCHPAIDPKIQVPLTLREVCGLATDEIASAFLTSPSTMAQRIVRGKMKIRNAGIPFVVPSLNELPSRLDAVLSVVYLVFNEGYSASAGKSLTRIDLSEEAIRLARLLLELLPDPEVMGLLALMLLHESRRAARTSPDGEIVLLEDQDRTLWNGSHIEEGKSLVESALASRRFGFYTLQAAISAVHSDADRADQTDWRQIAALYAVLMHVECLARCGTQSRCGGGHVGWSAGRFAADRRNPRSWKSAGIPSRPFRPSGIAKSHRQTRGGNRRLRNGTPICASGTGTPLLAKTNFAAAKLSRAIAGKKKSKIFLPQCRCGGCPFDYT